MANNNYFNRNALEKVTSLIADDQTHSAWGMKTLSRLINLASKIKIAKQYSESTSLGIPYSLPAHIVAELRDPQVQKEKKEQLSATFANLLLSEFKEIAKMYGFKSNEIIVYRFSDDATTRKAEAEEASREFLTIIQEFFL